MAVGSKLDFVAKFLGRTLAYTHEIVEYKPGRRLVMRTAQGPFPMEKTYTLEPVDGGHIRMRLRNRGEPSGFAAVAQPVMVVAMKRANTKDLANLKRRLESDEAAAWLLVRLDHAMTSSEAEPGIAVVTWSPGDGPPRRGRPRGRPLIKGSQAVAAEHIAI